MTLYNSKYVYFDWNNRLEEKKGFVAQNIASLKNQVNTNPKAMVTLSSSSDDVCPFTYYADGEITCDYQFAYYDPYYEYRKAYLEGKQLQFKTSYGWEDVNGEPCFVADTYRIKPEEIIYAEYFDGHIVKSHHPTPENITLQSESEKEIDSFIDNGEHLEEIIKAGKEGKKIQFKEFGVSNDPWKEVTGWNDLRDHDFVHYEYRIDECDGCLDYDKCKDKNGVRCRGYKIAVEYVPFETLDELISKWEGMNPGCTNRPECAMPMIWVKNKGSRCIYLISGYEADSSKSVNVGGIWYTLKELFHFYTFINDSIIGKRKEK